MEEIIDVNTNINVVTVLDNITNEEIEIRMDSMFFAFGKEYLLLNNIIAVTEYDCKNIDNEFVVVRIKELSVSKKYLFEKFDFQKLIVREID